MIYEIIVRTRNLLYDLGWMPLYQPPVPVIVVGNLVAGGTGKTPMVGWLAEKLKGRYRVAVLSRGYMRKSSGFRIVETSSSPAMSGDEPLELKLRHPDILVAVDRNRSRGIKILSGGDHGKIDLILMDDGFQHRQVKPTLSIILDDFNRPMHKEKLIPSGRLREPLSALRRADILITTKVPPGTEPVKPHTVPASNLIPAFYSRLRYQDPVNLFSLNNPIHLRHPDQPSGTNHPFAPGAAIILVTGIASPSLLQDYMSRKGRILTHLKFGDHHRYTTADISRLVSTFKNFAADSPIIVTTGKDFVKLAGFPELSSMPVYRVPVVPEFDQEQELLSIIEHHVESNQ